MGEAIEKIGKLEKLGREVERVDEEKISQIQPNREHFERLMTQGVDPQRQVAVVEQTDTAKKVTPMEVAVPNRPARNRVPNPQDIIVQATEAIQRMESIKRKLSIPNLQIPNGEVHVLKNKLSHIQDSIKIALDKVGLDYVPPDSPKGLMSPLQKFIGYLTHGQAHLEGLNAEVATIAESKEQLDPGRMLALQTRVGFINSELEFFASALNKSLESFKTIMNVQV